MKNPSSSTTTTSTVSTTTTSSVNTFPSGKPQSPPSLKALRGPGEDGDRAEMKESDDSSIQENEAVQDFDNETRADSVKELATISSLEEEVMQKTFEDVISSNSLSSTVIIAEGKESVNKEVDKLSAPADQSKVTFPTKPERLKNIESVLIEIREDIKKEHAERKDKGGTKLSKFLNLVGFAANLVQCFSVIQLILSIKDGGFQINRILDSKAGDPVPNAAIKAITRAWRKMPDSTWWKSFSDYMRMRSDFTITDHIFFLQLTMMISAYDEPVTWKSHQYRLDIADNLIQYYKEGNMDISDLYLQITEEKYHYDGHPLPRADAANELILALGGILFDKLSIRRTVPLFPKNALSIDSWDAKDKPGENSAWVCKDAQVRYGIAYVRNEINSLINWTDWIYLAGKSKPTLKNIPIPVPEEKIDSIRIYRQFGVAPRDKQPSGMLPLYEVIVEFKDKDKYPSVYQDIKPASAILLKPSPLLISKRPQIKPWIRPAAPQLEMKEKKKTRMTLQDVDKGEISTILDIAGALAWADPETAPFVNAGILLAKWI